MSQMGFCLVAKKRLQSPPDFHAEFASIFAAHRYCSKSGKKLPLAPFSDKVETISLGETPLSLGKNPQVVRWFTYSPWWCCSSHCTHKIFLGHLLQIRGIPKGRLRYKYVAFRKHGSETCGYPEGQTVCHVLVGSSLKPCMYRFVAKSCQQEIPSWLPASSKPMRKIDPINKRWNHSPDCLPLSWNQSSESVSNDKIQPLFHYLDENTDWLKQLHDLNQGTCNRSRTSGSKTTGVAFQVWSAGPVAKMAHRNGLRIFCCAESSLREEVYVRAWISSASLQRSTSLFNTEVLLSDFAPNTCSFSATKSRSPGCFGTTRNFWKLGDPSRFCSTITITQTLSAEVLMA